MINEDKLGDVLRKIEDILCDLVKESDDLYPDNNLYGEIGEIFEEEVKDGS